MRLFVTGTDTDVGKTRITAAVARALAAAGARPTIVKLAQTGLPPGEPGDAAIAADLAGCPGRELVRYPLASDPWSAALAAGAAPPMAAELAAALAPLFGALVLEGAGGAAVPLNATETLTDAARIAGAGAIVVVGLRLGCINHARLTVAYLSAAGVPVHGAVLVARWEPIEESYLRQVRRGLESHVPLLGVVPFERDAARSVANASPLFHTLSRLSPHA